MKTTININGKPVEIELTPEQVQAIKLQTTSITDRIKSYEDACEELGINPLTLDHFRFLPEKDRKSTFAFHKMSVIIRALNGGVEPDFSDKNQEKFFIWWKKNPSGVGFSFYGYGGTRSDTYVGSRLTFLNKDHAIYFAENFSYLFDEFSDQESI